MLCLNLSVYIFSQNIYKIRLQYYYNSVSESVKPLMSSQAKVNYACCAIIAQKHHVTKITPQKLQSTTFHTISRVSHVLSYSICRKWRQRHVGPFYSPFPVIPLTAVDQCMVTLLSHKQRSL